MADKSKIKDAPADTCPACGRKRADASTVTVGAFETTACACGYVWDRKAIEES